MSAGYQKAARVLRELDSADRDWLLAQFPAEDRERLEGALAKVDAPAGSAAPPTSIKPRADSGGPEPTAVSRLAAADVDAVEQLLQGEPDWIVALLLMHTAWPWLPMYLGRRPAAELERFQELARQLESKVKRPARNAIIDACARRLDALRPPAPRLTPFERLLAAARQRVESQPAATEAP